MKGLSISDGVTVSQSDRELFERAASAAGYRVVQWAEDGSAWVVPVDTDGGYGFWWTPLVERLGEAARRGAR